MQKIYLSIEKQKSGCIDYEDDNTDVIVYLENGEIYSGSFFSYKNIASIIARNKESGEFLAGKYFWATAMVLIDDISLESVTKVVGDLIDEGDFPSVFRKL